MKLSIETMLRLGLITLVGMSVGAVIIDRFSDDVDIASMIMLRESILWQLVVGIGFGLVSGYIAFALIQLPFMESVRNKYSSIFNEFDLSVSEIWFISFCAGVGEELLFRGALQPLFGIPITSIVFVAIHGYLNPSNWRLSIYGIFMTIVIACIGWAAQAFGLISAIVAHILIDVILLGALVPKRFKA